MGDDIVDRLWEGVWHHGGEVRVLLKPAAQEIERLRAEHDRLRDGIAQALTELDAEHRPIWVLDRNIGHGTTESQHEAAPGKEPIGCVMCYAEDGSWPCATRLIADDLRALIEEEET